MKAVTIIARLLPVVSSLLLSAGSATSQLFGASIEAAQTDKDIEITAIIANHSGHSACFLAVNQGSFVIRYKNGSWKPGVVNSEPCWKNGVLPPSPIQLVPADGRSYRFSWLTIPLYDANKAQIATVEVTVTLDDCRGLISEHDVAQRKVFEARLSAPVS